MKLSIIYVFLLFLYLGSCCQKETNMTWFGCQVKTSDCQDGFYMSQCKERYCAQYETYYDENGTQHSTCVRYDYYYHDNSTCIEECCGDAGLGVQQWDAEFVTICEAQNQRLHTELGIILGSVFGGLALIGIGIFCYCKHKEEQ